MAAEGHKTCSLSFTIVMNLSKKFLLLPIVSHQVRSCMQGRHQQGTVSWQSCLFQGDAAAPLLPRLLPLMPLWELPPSMKAVWSMLLLQLLQGSGRQCRGFLFLTCLSYKKKKKKRERDSCRMGSVVRKQLRNSPCLHNFDRLDNKLTEQREEWEEEVSLVPVTGNPFQWTGMHLLFCVSSVSLSPLEWVLATKPGSPLAPIFSDPRSEERGLFISPLSFSFQQGVMSSSPVPQYACCPFVICWSDGPLDKVDYLYLQDDKKNQYLLLVPISPWLAELASSARVSQTLLSQGDHQP